MKGMNVLEVFQFVDADRATVILLIGVIGFVILAAAFCTQEFWPFGLIGVICLVGSFIAWHATELTVTQCIVTFDKDFDLGSEEFLEKYKIINHMGKQYTLELKE